MSALGLFFIIRMQYTVIFLYFSETLSKLETRGSQVQLNSTKHLVLEHILVWTKHTALSCKVTTRKKKKRLKKIEELQNHNRPAIPYTCVLLSKYIPKGHNGKGRQEKNKGRRRIFLLNFSRTKPKPNSCSTFAVRVPSASPLLYLPSSHNFMHTKVSRTFCSPSLPCICECVFIPIIYFF